MVRGGTSFVTMAPVVRFAISSWSNASTSRSIPAKQGTALIQKVNLGKFFLRQSKVQTLQIFCHPLPVDGFGDDGDSILGQITQRDLPGGLAVLCADLVQQRFRKDVPPTFGERSPGLHLGAVTGKPLFQFQLRIVNMRLYLIDGGHDAAVLQKPVIFLLTKIGDADGPYRACRIGLFECFIHFQRVPIRLWISSKSM